MSCKSRTHLINLLFTLIVLNHSSGKWSVHGTKYLPHMYGLSFCNDHTIARHSRSIVERCLSPACSYLLRNVTKWRSPLSSTWLSMAPSLVLDTSVNMVNSCWKSGVLRTGPVINAVFNFSKATSHSLDHRSFSAFLLFQSDKGVATVFCWNSG